MFHRFAELGTTPSLVRSMNLDYNSDTAFTFLKSITQKGFIRNQDGSYTEKALPPVEFNYEPLGWNTEVKSLSKESRENLPMGIDDNNYQWIDLYNEGISEVPDPERVGLLFSMSLSSILRKDSLFLFMILNTMIFQKLPTIGCN